MAGAPTMCVTHEFVFDNDLIRSTGHVLQPKDLFSRIRGSQDDISSVDKKVGGNFFGRNAEVFEGTVTLVTQQGTCSSLGVKLATANPQDRPKLIWFRDQLLVVKFFPFHIDRPAEISFI